MMLTRTTRRRRVAVGSWYYSQAGCLICVACAGTVGAFHASPLHIRPLSLPQPRRQLVVQHSQMSDLAVSLDRPVLGPPHVHRTPSASASVGRLNNFLRKMILPILLSDVFKVASVAMLIALVISALRNASHSGTPTTVTNQKLGSPSFGNFFEKNFKASRGKITRLLHEAKGLLGLKSPSTDRRDGIPMQFHPSVNDGWGKSTLRSKTTLGESPYVKYTFELPLPQNTLPLQLGQKLALCCLDRNDKVVRGDFYLSSPRSTKGTFSIAVPYKDTIYALGRKNARFVKVLEDELNEGDEVAIQPGPPTLSYGGQDLPVTDIVYFCGGGGIIPIVEQVKSILPSKTSTVTNLSVVWVNDDSASFDLAYRELEDEFYKYNTRLEVSCCIENTRAVDSFDNMEDIEQSVPDYSKGTMTVVSGPVDFSEKAVAYLYTRGYPEETVCVLPP